MANANILISTMFSVKKIVPVLFLTLGAAQAQQIPLNDLSAFKNPSANWSIGADATADLNAKNTLVGTAGKGTLICVHTDGK